MAGKLSFVYENNNSGKFAVLRIGRKKTHIRTKTGAWDSEFDIMQRLMKEFLA